MLLDKLLVVIFKVFKVSMFFNCFGRDLVSWLLFMCNFNNFVDVYILGKGLVRLLDFIFRYWFWNVL